MENKKEEYLIVKGIADDMELEQYRLCFKNNGSPREIENLQWLHQKNPVNTNTIYYAMAGNDVAAIYTAIPVFFIIAGEKKTALQSIDTMTDAAHRGKGLFPKLATRLYADAQISDYAFVYGFPNENSAPGFFNKLKWVSFGEAPFLLKPLSILYFLKKFLKKGVDIQASDENYVYTKTKQVKISSDTEIKELDCFSEDYEVIWRNVSQKNMVAIDRSAAYMNWRFVDKPEEDYSRYGLFTDGKLTGVIVFTLKNKHGGRVGYIMEMIYNLKFSTAGDVLLKFASKVFKQQKVDASLAWCFPHAFNYSSFKKAGYYNLPVKLRPQHLFLGVRTFTEKNSSLINNVNNWYISYSDSDTV